MEFKGINMDFYTLAFLIFFTLLIQFIAIQFTKAKCWSYQCMIRNIAITLAAYAVYKGVTPAVFLIVIFIEIGMEYINGVYGPIDPWVTTDYLYSDYFESFVHTSKPLQYYTEGTYGSLLGFSPLETDIKKIQKIINYGVGIAENAKYGQSTVTHIDGLTQLPLEDISKKSQHEKFDWFVQKCGIKEGTKVLEIGFGKTDFMEYLTSLGAKVTGVNISQKQVDQANSKGLRAIRANFRKISPEALNAIGNNFDVIITNGSMEYLRLTTEPDDSYLEVFKLIRSLLKKHGVFCCATLHLTNSYLKNEPFWQQSYNFFMKYLLWAGNDGSYPHGREGLIKYAKIAGFELVHQENRWLDYFMYSCIWSASFQRYFGRGYFNLKLLKKVIPLLIANPHFIQSYITYTPLTKNPYLNPWFWQFLPQNNCEYVPTTHEWIILKLEN